jgi:regulator of protease activity HflC (stomatin/prohibitin superfamily)
MDPLLIVALVVVLFVVAVLGKAVRIVPQARARNVERLGRYQRTLTPGLNVVLPFVDRVYPAIDLREQVVSFPPRPVITEDNLVVEIDTVLYFQVTDARSAAYEIASYLHAVEQLTVTTLRNVVGSMDLEETLTSRDEINSRLRGVLDEATGKWGLRVNRVEIKAVDPPKSIKDAMEKQMRAERDKRASILAAEGARQSQILTAEGDKQGAILRAEGERTSAVLRAEGEARAIDQVFQAVHRNDLDPRVLAYQYLQTLPELARGDGNTFWVIPSEVTSALAGVAQAFGPGVGAPAAAEGSAAGSAPATPAFPAPGPVGAIGTGQRTVGSGAVGSGAVGSGDVGSGDVGSGAVGSDGAGSPEIGANGTGPNGAGAEVAEERQPVD